MARNKFLPFCHFTLLVLAVEFGVILPAVLGNRVLRGNYVQKVPVVGIYTHPFYGHGVHPSKSFHPELLGSMIGSSYVKLMQTGGVHVVPIFFDSTDIELKKAFKSVNMILFTGGFASIAPTEIYFQNAKKLFEMAVIENNNGNYFPIHGTCLGLELLASIVSNVSKSALFSKTDSHALPSFLKFTTKSALSKSIFAGIDPHLLEAVQTQNLTVENHIFGLLPQTLRSNGKLESFFEVLTTSFDRNGVEYVSTIAAYGYPFSATQWHPEKPPFEYFHDPTVPHSKQSIQISQSIANYFAQEATKNSHNIPMARVVRMVVENYKLEFHGSYSQSHYDSVYLLPTRKERGAKGSLASA